MNSDDLKKRTKLFALKVIKMVDQLPRAPACQVIGKQILKSATSVGANYRAACRARSQADFISKITVVEEETDETAYWLELLLESGLVKTDMLEELLKKSYELTAIFTASGRSAKIRNFQSAIRNNVYA